MLISIPPDKADELVEVPLYELTPLDHENVDEPVRHSQSQRKNTVSLEIFETEMSSIKKSCDEIIAWLKKFLNRVNLAKRYLADAAATVKKKVLPVTHRRSARSHRSKSVAKSTASNSSSDGSDPDPASPPAVSLSIKVKSVFSIGTVFTNRLSPEGA
ncbi:hypothetical protein MUU47_22825 [Scandinavium sp. H11S7]|uniref:Uncharacterized protein n=1 Tax=Scandinavium hiltneri TaxID=2926519 RepID=A0ABT2E7P7_9ENTR|nr:hypothetical protein [Scandinavium hiltneri]MCS2163910.1 hypothetical protein [Scandinavium hiltneri]